MQSVLEAIRKACLPGVWSQGVKLAREGAVSAGTSTPSERTFRVRAPGHAIALTVTLYLEGPEWTCDCVGKTDPCAHVAAAIIAAAKAAERGESLTAAPATRPARLTYRLAAKDRLLTMIRVLVHGDGREERLAETLASSLARGRTPEGWTPTHEDLKVERILGTPPREIVQPGRVRDLFTAFGDDAEITLDGTPVRVSGEPVAPHARVDDVPGGGFRLRLDRDAAITGVVAKGVVRCGDVLHPLGEANTTGELLDRLPLERIFTAAQAGELVTTVLPELERKIDVIIATTRLPRRAAEARPRIAMDLSHQGHTLSVLPTLVYGDPPVARVDGDRVVALGDQVPTRRPAEEREVLRRLRDELNLVPGRRVDLNGSEAIRFAAKLRDWQKRSGDAGHADAFAGRPLRPRLAIDGDAYDVLFECEPGDEAEAETSPKRAEARAVIRAWQDGLDLVPLEGGGWAPLPADWLERHGHLVADLLAARGPDKKVGPTALVTLGPLCDALDTPRPAALARLAPLFGQFEGIPRAPLPEGLHASLRHYQQEGVDWLAFLRDAELGAVLADDMGLGKTLQTICVLRGRVLVVCPKSVVYNWVDEIERFRPGLRTALYEGPKRKLDRTADVTLMTYAVLRLDADLIAQEAWDVVVLDEGQAIKNLGSQTARAAFGLQGKFRVLLSGTPVENRLEELWSAMHFANPGLLGGVSDFQQRYSSPIASGNPEAAARLRAKIRPFVLRRTKREVLPELPSRTDSVLHVELDEAERSVYDAVRVATRKSVAEKLSQGGGVLAALEALLRLRQAACHSGLVPGQHAETSSKVERLIESLEDAVSEGHKALVFSQWTSLLDRIEPHLAAAQIRFTRLDGSTRDRAAVVHEFQDEGGPPVLLVSLKAGGTGLNLTAADHVFLLDPWWNPAVEEQAADRAHRFGQERPVMVYRMVTKDTVEERILALQERKRQIAQVALGEAGQAGGITRDELLALLE
ncbi:MAG TPA: DEAD/DEAH box helicase [Polyangiaceae bacterium]|nr:DEAD/DEAH box helicase [Polyangiaceae bacterium]